MNLLRAALADIGRLLDGIDVEWALVGGLAVSVRAEPRFTRDVDLVVAVESDPEAESLVRQLRGHGYADDLGLARRLTRLIEARGYHRGRDLTAELERLAARPGRR